MKNLFSFLAFGLMMLGLSACSNDQDDFNVIPDMGQKNETKTISSKVEYVDPLTRAAGTTRARKAPEAPTLVSASFFIRIDGNVPVQELGNPAVNYFPRRGGNGNYYSVFCVMNEGKIIDGSHWKTAEGQWTKYLYDSKALATQNFISEAPSLEKLVKSNQVEDDKAALEELLENDNLHILWYLVAYDSYNFRWHVDGIVTTKDVTEISQTSIGEQIAAQQQAEGREDQMGILPEIGDEPVQMAGEVEFDVHQQVHSDWNEIKTSIHLRDTVDARILIPIPVEYQAETDDFAIRSGAMYEYINKTIKIENKEFTVKFSVQHTAEGIVITIGGSECAEALKAARQAYGDGLTFEVHTYAKPEATPEQIWSWLKQTKRPDTYKGTWTEGSIITHTHGQVTSAYYPDEFLGFDE